MAFPLTGILDDFNRANQGPPPSSDWTTGISVAGGLKVVGNVLVANASGSDHDGYWDSAQFGPNCEVYVDVSTLASAGVAIKLWLRIQQPGNGTIDGYYVQLRSTPNPDEITVNRVDNDVATQLGATVTGNWASGDKIGFEAIGDDLTVYRHSGSWSSYASRTDSTYQSASGHIGVSINGSSWDLDNFGGGTIPRSLPPRPPLAAYHHLIVR